MNDEIRIRKPYDHQWILLIIKFKNQNRRTTPPRPTPPSWVKEIVGVQKRTCERTYYPRRKLQKIMTVAAHFNLNFNNTLKPSPYLAMLPHIIFEQLLCRYLNSFPPQNIILHFYKPLHPSFKSNAWCKSLFTISLSNHKIRQKLR